MSGIIKNKWFKDDEKIKLYNQSLNKYINRYDPKTAGLAPVLVELIAKLKSYIDNDNKRITSMNRRVLVAPSSSVSIVSQNKSHLNPYRELLN